MTATAAAGPRRFSPVSKAALFGVLALVVITALAKFTDKASEGDATFGPQGSSISTGDGGTAAWRELLARYDVDVREQRGELNQSALDPGTTLVVIDPWDMPSGSIDALRSYVQAGGRLVTAGTSPGWLSEIVELPEWTPGAPPRLTAFRDERFNTRSLPEGSWRAPDGLVAVARLDGGEVRAVANSSPLRNELLDAADNAAFAVSLVGTDRPVVFAEGVHGFGRRTGISAIPQRWKAALVLGTLAALLTAMAVTRRLGPPERTARALPPPRAAYVDAVAELLRRSKQPRAALEPMQAQLRAAVVARAAGGADDPTAAATLLGWTPEEIAVLDGPIEDDARVLLLGRTMAKIRSEQPSKP